MSIPKQTVSFSGRLRWEGRRVHNCPRGHPVGGLLHHRPHGCQIHVRPRQREERHFLRRSSIGRRQCSRGKWEKYAILRTKIHFEQNNHQPNCLPIDVER